MAQIPGLQQLWAQTLGDPRICIAILDGPVDLSHAAFQGAALTQVSVSEVKESCRVVSDHGTHVASIIFGQHHSRVKGIAPRCRGLIVPFFDYAEDGSLKPSSQERLAKAIRTALHYGANIINISGGQFTSDGQASDDLKSAVAQCEGKAIIIAAAGNDGCDCLHIPGALPSVLAVGAMNVQGEPLPFSNWGEAYREHGVLAPGEQILGASLDGRVARYTGTSFATPIVSGIAGLALSAVIQSEQIPRPSVLRGAILQSAIDCKIQPTSDCSKLLSGRLNVSGVVEALQRGSNEMHETSFARSPEASVPTVAPVERINASGCGCGCKSSAPELVYTIGRLSYEFASQARERSIRQHMISLPGTDYGPDPKDPLCLLRYLLGYSEIHIDKIGIGRIHAISEQSRRVLLHLDNSIELFDPEDVGRKVQLDGLLVLGGSAPSELNGLQEIRAVDPANRTILLQARHVGQPYQPNSGSVLLPRSCEKSPKVQGPHLYDAAAVIWTIERDSYPFYAVAPEGPFSEEAYQELAGFLLEQAGIKKESLDYYYYSGPGNRKFPWKYGWDPRFNDPCCFAPTFSTCCDNYQSPGRPVTIFPAAECMDDTSQVAIPGQLAGTVTLMDGHVVPVINPNMRGSEAWSFRNLFHKKEFGNVDAESLDPFVETLFHRFAEEIRNGGRSPEDRALNFASFQLLLYLSDKDVYPELVRSKLELDRILAPRQTRACPPNSLCYTVEITLFDPDQIHRANTVVSVTVDVSDVVPVLLDGPRKYQRRS